VEDKAYDVMACKGLFTCSEDDACLRRDLQGAGLGPDVSLDHSGVALYEQHRDDVVGTRVPVRSHKGPLKCYHRRLLGSDSNSLDVAKAPIR
jgi:hypothetical protein